MKHTLLDCPRQSSTFLLLLLILMATLPRFVAASLLPPMNDDFSGRVQIGPGNVHTNGTMLGASQENGELLVLFGFKSVWWVWNATNSGPVTVAVDAALNDVESYFPFLSIEVSTGGSLGQLAQVAVGSSDMIANPADDCLQLLTKNSPVTNEGAQRLHVYETRRLMIALAFLASGCANVQFAAPNRASFAFSELQHSLQPSRPAQIMRSWRPRCR